MPEYLKYAFSCWLGTPETPLRQPWGASAGLQQGSALASVVSVYRNDVWQRVPKLLLVEVSHNVTTCTLRLAPRNDTAQ